MTLENIEKAARQGSELADGLSQPEQLLFLSLRAIYSSYRRGEIGIDQARREKAEAIMAHDTAKTWHEIFEDTVNMRNRLSTHLSGINKNGCGHCQLAVKIFNRRV